MTEVKALAVEVRGKGYIHTAHMLRFKFTDSAKKITNTIKDIPDIEVKENFSKFLKSLEIHTKDVTVEELDIQL